MAEKKNTRYTYSQFAEDILELLDCIDVSDFGLDYEKMSEKARALIEQQERKRAYNANKRAENAGKPKELSDKMKDLIALIKPAIPKGIDNAVTGTKANPDLTTGLTFSKCLRLKWYQPRCAGACSPVLLRCRWAQPLLTLRS